jgi:DNA repair protein RadD
LLWIARDKHYKDGWAAYKHKEKFGSWPPRVIITPLPPDDAVRSWVRSRQIAYAREQEKLRSV